MKKVFLIGDSTRVGATVQVEGTVSPGYERYVRDILDECEIYSPSENCRFSQYTLRYLHEWASGVPKDIDAVHWNNGLWDVLRLFGDEPFSDLDCYGETLVRIHKRIRMLFPRAKVIFALSTSVKEEWGSPDFMRRSSDVELYNAKAMEVLVPLGVTVNDLYSTTIGFDDSLRSDWVHYNEEGSRILARQVAEHIRKVLGE